MADLASGRFSANSAWILCAAVAHNLLREPPAHSPVTSTPAHADSRYDVGSSTIPPDWPAPQRRPILRLPTHWPWSKHTGSHCGATPSDTAHHPREEPVKPADSRAHSPTIKISRPAWDPAVVTGPRVRVALAREAGHARFPPRRLQMAWAAVRARPSAVGLFLGRVHRR